jgi:virginiamycin B lyase
MASGRALRYTLAEPQWDGISLYPGGEKNVHIHDWDQGGNVMSNRTFALVGLVFFGPIAAVALPKHCSISMPSDAGNLNVKIQEWAVPTKGAHPHDPAVGADGALWFTEQMVNKLGRLDPKTGEFKEYPLATDKNSGPHGLVADKEGNIWFTANFGGYIGKLDPRTGKVTEYKMPSEKADDPHTVVFDARGILWFTVQGGNMVGRLDPKSGKIELKEVPTESALPYGIQVNSKGVPIFCELGTNKMASIDPQTMAIKEYPLPEGVRPRRLAIAADDTVYFTDFKSGHLGTLNTSTASVKLFNSPGGAEANPYGIAITPDGMVWYSESGVHPNTIVRFDPKTQTFASAKIPSGGGVVRNMAATSDGRVYIACSGVDKVGVVSPAK